MSNNRQPIVGEKVSQTNQVDEYIKNFSFPTLRERQSYVLNEIAPLLTLTLGTSYICTSTKDLQTQYARDFPFLKVAKGKNNFICAVKD